MFGIDYRILTLTLAASVLFFSALLVIGCDGVPVDDIDINIPDGLLDQIDAASGAYQNYEPRSGFISQ